MSDDRHNSTPAEQEADKSADRRALETLSGEQKERLAQMRRQEREAEEQMTADAEPDDSVSGEGSPGVSVMSGGYG